MNGIELATKLRKMNKKYVIILASAEEDIDNSQLFDYVFVKPITKINRPKFYFQVYFRYINEEKVGVRAHM